MKVRVSELNKRISIIEIEDVEDDEGFVEEKEIEVCKCWASVNNTSGKEVYRNKTDFSQVVTRFLVRYRRDIEIDTNMYVKFRNKLYNIIYLNNYAYDDKYLEIICEKVE